MRKRLIEAGIGVLGLVVIALAIASATLWRADDVLVARATATAGLVVTDPGVLELGGDPVTVRAEVPAGARVVLAVGRDTDVTGWVGSDRYQRVSGLSGWRTLRLAAPAATTAAPTPSGNATAATPAGEPTQTGAAPADATATAGATAQPTPGTTATPAADPAGSDMWVARATGTGSAQLVWRAQDGRWSLLVAGIAADGTAVAPTLEMSWPRVVSAPWLVPGLVVGGLLLLTGAGLMTRDWWRARTGRDGWTAVETGSLPAVVPAGPAPALTRRQLRELQSRSARPPTGAVQAVVVPDTQAKAGGPAPSASAPSPVPTASAQPAGRWSPGGGPSPHASTVPAGRGSAAPATGTAPLSLPPVGAQVRTSADAVTAADAARRAAAARAVVDERTVSRNLPAETQPRPVAGSRPLSPPSDASAGQSAAPAAPPWAASSRRGRRAAAASGERVPDAAAELRDAPARPVHEGRPTWASTPRPSSVPDLAAGTSRPVDAQRPASAQAAPSAGAGSATSTPPRPGGWVPVPGGGPTPAPAAPPGAGGSTSSPAGQRPVHPSWLAGPSADSARLVPPPGTADARHPSPKAPAQGPDDAAGDERGREPAEAEETPSSRADAWRRAWGLPPVEPPDDEAGGSDR